MATTRRSSKLAWLTIMDAIIASCIQEAMTLPMSMTSAMIKHRLKRSLLATNMINFSLRVEMENLRGHREMFSFCRRDASMFLS